MQQDDIQVVGATRVNVGLSLLVKLAPQPYESNLTFKIISGGTLEIVKNDVAALSGSSATGWGAGYPLSSGEVFNIGGPAAVYLAASSATVVVGLVYSYSAGATLGV